MAVGNLDQHALCILDIIGKFFQGEVGRKRMCDLGYIHPSLMTIKINP